MKRLLISLLALTLTGLGCGRQEPEEQSVATPVAPTAENVTAPTIPPPPPPAPATTTPSQPSAAVTAPTESLDQLVQQYQALAGRVDARGELISDVAGLVDADTAPEQVADALGKMLMMETDSSLKVELLDELGLMEHPAALDPLLQSIHPGQSPEILESAIDNVDTLLSDLAFGEDPAMLDTILKATDARYPVEVRVSAISALEDLEDQRAIPVLQGLLNDGDPEIREAAEEAIDWLAD